MGFFENPFKKKAPPAESVPGEQALQSGAEDALTNAAIIGGAVGLAAVAVAPTAIGYEMHKAAESAAAVQKASSETPKVQEVVTENGGKTTLDLEKNEIRITPPGQ